jgi:Tfp pilus assembly protein PilF
MRKSLILAASLLAVAAAPVPKGRAAPQGDDLIKPASVKLAQDGQAALAKGQALPAFQSFEAAAAVDPRNRGAFVGMAKASQAMGLPGQAVKFYREALELEPNDLAAIAGQGEALLQRGATARAKANLDRLKSLCGSCAQTSQLAAAIAKAPPQQTAEAAPKPPAADAKN